MQQKKSISTIKSGMTRDKNISQLSGAEYTFLLNGSTSNEAGDATIIQNEPSNQFAVDFQDYKVIGFKNDILKERTYYFLTNPTTRKSSIGYVDNLIVEVFNNDVEQECPDCNYSNVLGVPLETTTQVPVLEYVELINDNCHIDAGREGLNFNINFPAKKIEIKQEKLGTTLYWNDNRNPKRYINISNIEENPTTHYLLTQEVPCDEDIIVDCILVDKLLTYPNHNKIQIEAETIQTGGNLKMGTYEFYAVYCDLLGNEMVNYSTPTNPISIFDENNNNLSQTTTDAFTNFAIKLKVNNLDSKAFKYYKVVCVERNNVDNTQSAFVEGIHPTTDDTVVYTHSGSSVDDNITRGNVSIKRRIDLATLNLVKPHYDRAKGTMISGGRMFDYGLYKREELNLQPVVNLFSALAQWQTSAAKEDLYKSAIATSKYKGYMRNEVQPFSFRFFYKDGDYSAVFPWVGRPANSIDLEVVSDTNYQSISANTPACGVNTRNKKWQIFNTATGDESCSTITEGATIIETINKSCNKENVFEIPTNTITIETEDIFQGLEEYIEANPDAVIPEITPYLEDDYLEHCPPNFGSVCDSPVLIESYNDIAIVLTGTEELVIGEEYLIQSLEAGDTFSNVGFINENEPFTATGTTPSDWTNGTVLYLTKETLGYVDKVESEYVKAIPTQACTLYKRDTATGAYIQDTAFESNFMPCFDTINPFDPIDRRKKVYKRDSEFRNENCSIAEAIADNVKIGVTQFLNYGGDTVLANLLTAYNVEASAVTADFQNKLHKKALFFKAFKNDRDRLILEITPNSDCQSDRDELDNLGLLRYTIYDRCGAMNVLGGDIINTTNGLFLEIDVATFPNTFLVAIDAPITSELREDDCVTPVTSTTVYKIVPPCGCFSIFTRDIEHKAVEVTWTKIILDKIEKYNSQCTFSIPNVNECEPSPYAKGTFAYWESSETYPDNNQLYNSSTLKIKPSDLNTLSIDVKDRFKEYFTENGSIDPFGNYILKEDTNLTCKPIRHSKFPDNTVATFMHDSESQQAFSDTIIFPLGITLDANIVSTMLQVARVNGLITQKELDNIEGYEILRGDNTIHKSVIANGLAFDMYNYDKEDGNKWWYSNFPFNDLGDDKFHTSDANRKNLIKHPNNGNGNHLFSFLSPDIFLTRPSIPTEVVLAGYQSGKASESIVDVKDHPKYTIPGQDARDLATTLAYAEFVLEVATKVAEFTTQSGIGTFWITVGATGGGGNGIGAGLSTGALVVYGVAVGLQGLARIGQYRYEWLKTFRDLGATYNFVAMTVGIGNYNKFLKVENESTEYLRGLSVRKYIKDGMFNTTDKAIPLNINNWLREESVLLSTGANYKFNYPEEYKSIDNNKLGIGEGSKILSSEINCKINQETARDIASPYFSLKNYIPDQWGTIDSIKWLTTNYMSKITDNTDCRSIFGGTVCISPFSWRRKTPLFRENAMSQPTKSPFSYSEYNNIGFTKYFLDYEVDSIYKAPVLKIPFPDIKSNFNFDCEAGKTGFYVKPPSKMYLYSYGIVNFLVESEINCHFRYAGKEQKDGFYPKISNVAEWVQEKNMSISEPNTFYYNNSYSFPVSNTAYKFLDYNYDKEIWRKRGEQPNALIYSEIENNENALTDPWLVFKPLNFYEFETKFGKLIDLKDIESSQFLARFENQLVLHNAIDNLADRITPQNKELGTGGIGASRPLEFKSTDLGFAGTQNTDISSTPYGHFYVDAKRGRVFQIDQNGKNLDVISEQVGNQPTNMKQWFREQLPFKILKQFPKANVDNKFKGLGMNIFYDDRNSRIFFTKRDYISKGNPCLKYNDEIGFYDDCLENDIICPDNYTYNPTTQMCELIIDSDDLCLPGYTYDEELGTCTLITTTSAECTEFISVSAVIGASETPPTSNFSDLLTISEVKCAAEASNYCNVIGRNFYVETILYTVGQQTFILSGGNYLPSTYDGYHIVGIINIIGGCGGAVTDGDTKILKLLDGVITEIATYNTITC